MIVAFLYICFWFFLSFFYEWIKRKVSARIQKRVGPAFTGKFGILQPFADFIKLLSKEDILPEGSSRFLIFISINLLLFLPLLSFFFLPFSPVHMNFNADILLILSLFAFQSLLFQLIGLSSLNRFATIGAGRTILQALSFELPFFVSLLSPFVFFQTLSIFQVYQKTSFFLFSLSSIIAFVCLLVKFENLPFDIPEAPQEIVAGWQTELSGKKLAFVKLSKNLFELFSLSFFLTIFVGFASPIDFSFKLLFLIFLFIFFKNVFARLRIGEAVKIGWFLFLLSLLQIFILFLLESF